MSQCAGVVGQDGEANLSLLYLLMPFTNGFNHQQQLQSYRLLSFPTGGGGGGGGTMNHFLCMVRQIYLTDKTSECRYRSHFTPFMHSVLAFPTITR